jgi:hypothetical protein
VKLTLSNSLRCAIAALFFLFAVTADVVVKAVVDDEGHDANHPIIWIEHKCAGHLGNTMQSHVLPQIIIAVALRVPAQFFQDVPGAELCVSTSLGETTPPSSPPSVLRC